MHQKNSAAYTGVFGAILLEKGWCETCGQYALILKGKLQCCERACTSKPTQWKRESLATGQRAKPTKEYQAEQLAAQGHRCFYCDDLFGGYIRYRKQLVRVELAWDHLVPFAYLQGNPTHNFVAACRICNGIKSGKCFQTVHEANHYVATVRAQYDALSSLRTKLPAH